MMAEQQQQQQQLLKGNLIVLSTQNNNDNKLQLIILLNCCRKNLDRTANEPFDSVFKKITSKVIDIITQTVSNDKKEKKKKRKHAEHATSLVEDIKNDSPFSLIPRFKDNNLEKDCVFSQEKQQHSSNIYNAPCFDILSKIIRFDVKRGECLIATLEVNHNPPFVQDIQSIGLPSVGCPVLVHLKVSNPKAHYQIEWYCKAKDQKHTSPICATGKYYIPQIQDVDKILYVKAYCPEASYLEKTFTFSKLITNIHPCLWRDNRLLSFVKDTTRNCNDVSIIRVASFNILADGYTRTPKAANELFPYCPKEALSLHFRAPRILRELLDLNTDLFGLQECTPFFYEKVLIPILGNRYHFHLSIKMGKSLKEGCIIAFDKTKFEQLEFQEFDFKTTFTHDLTFKPLLDQLQTKWPGFVENVVPTLHTAFQISVLRFLHNDYKKTVIIFSNTHLFFHPCGSHIRLLQIFVLLCRLERIIRKYKEKGYTTALISLGDFNSQPESGAYQLVTEGMVSEMLKDWDLGPEFRYDSNRDLETILPNEFDNDEEENNVLHNNNDEISLKDDVEELPSIQLHLPNTLGVGLQLHSPLEKDSLYDVYTNQPNPFTNIVAVFKGTLDHLFISPKHFKIERLLSPITLEDILPNVALPSIEYPSDHIAIGAELKLL